MIFRQRSAYLRKRINRDRFVRLGRSDLRKVILIVVLAFAVNACSSDDTANTTSSLEKASAKKTSVGITASAQLIADGILSGEGQAVYRYLSQECREKITASEISSQLKTARSYLISFVGADVNEISISSVQTRKVDEGEKGQVRFTIEVSGKSRESIDAALEKRFYATSTTGVNQPYRPDSYVYPFDQPTGWFQFVYEDGSWKLKDCNEFLEASGLLSAPN